MEYAGQSADWSADAARHLEAFAGERSPAVDDLRVTAEALLVRYRVRDDRLALRARLDRDPTSWTAPTNSQTLASNLLHSLHSPDDLEWTDSDGYRWWGTEPDGGWPIVADEERTLTVR